MSILRKEWETTLRTKRRSGVPYKTYSTLHPYGLTRRENEVWGWLARGYTDQQIAVALGISPATVENHIKMIVERLPIGQAGEVRRLRAALLYNGIAIPG